MRTLITGISGFVGTALKRALLDAGHEMCGFDTRIPLDAGPGIHECDVRDIDRVESIFQLEKPDTCIHLAAIAHADIPPGAEERVRETNVKATTQVAKISADAGTRRFLFFSSAKVYGERTGPEGIDEEQEPKPEGLYGRLKFEAENRLGEIAGDTGLELLIVRPVAVFGPGDSRGNYSRLIRAVKRGFFPVVDGGRARRSIAFLPRVVQKIVHMVANPTPDSTPLVLSDGDFSLMEIMNAIRSATGIALFPPVPKVLARAIAGIIDAGWRVAGRETGPAGRILERLTESFVIRTHRYDKRFGALPSLDLNSAFREAASSTASS